MRTWRSERTGIMGTLAAALLLLFPAAPARGGPREPMNVLLLVADDLNPWMLGDCDRCAGRGVAPNLTHAIRQPGKSHDRPFPIACGLSNPHTPWYAPRKHLDMFPLEDVVVPEIAAGDPDDVPAPLPGVIGEEARSRK